MGASQLISVRIIKRSDSGTSGEDRIGNQVLYSGVLIGLTLYG